MAWVSFDGYRDKDSEWIEVTDVRRLQPYCYGDPTNHELNAGPGQGQRERNSGTGNTATKRTEWLPFEEARAVVHQLRLQSSIEWREFCKSGKRPSNIPALPSDVYRFKGWVSMPHWLGYERKRASNVDDLMQSISIREASGLSAGPGQGQRERHGGGGSPKSTDSGGVGGVKRARRSSLFAPVWLGFHHVTLRN